MQRTIATLERVAIPVEQAFGGRGISQSLSGHARVIDLGEPGTAGNNFCHGGRLLGVRH